jgi:hypothetical protein
LQRFFYPRPVFLPPLLDPGFVPLTGPALRELATPVQGVHEAPDMSRMEAYAKPIADDLSDSCRCPQLRVVAVGRWPSQ